jgi:hypothetical protein
MWVTARTNMNRNQRETYFKNYERKRNARCRSGLGSTTLRGRIESSRDIQLTEKSEVGSPGRIRP